MRAPAPPRPSSPPPGTNKKKPTKTTDMHDRGREGGYIYYYRDDDRTGRTGRTGRTRDDRIRTGSSLPPNSEPVPPLGARTASASPPALPPPPSQSPPSSSFLFPSLPSPSSLSPDDDDDDDDGAATTNRVERKNATSCAFAKHLGGRTRSVLVRRLSPDRDSRWLNAAAFNRPSIDGQSCPPVGGMHVAARPVGGGGGGSC